MEIATPIGMFLGFAAVMVSFIMEGGSPAAFIAPPAMLLVFGGTFGACLASNRFPDMGGIVKAALGVVKPGKKIDQAATVNQLMEFADIARKDGILALEERAKDIDDAFLKHALQLVIDGTDSQELAASLETEVDAQRIRHKVAAKFFADMGGFSPTLGIIGTVLGLVHALAGLADPKGLGIAISHAFIATLWGVMSANLIWLPIGNKLKRASELEAIHRYLIIQGVLAIQAGVSGRTVAERLKSHLAPKVRDTIGAKAEKAEKAA